ncbi:MAG: ABC transporter substrate-binding protein [Candidatus Thorarchaeota archaeon]|nr:ABC transporter substrate-binding protein [Candidatus Thorarchaeota archaeon]
MKNRRKMLYVVLAMFLFFPAIYTPTADAQDEEMLFVMAYGSDIGELNPLLWRSERSHWYDMLVYDTLLSYDDNLDLIPWLAEDYTVSSDGLTITFDIREGVTWHDGTPLTADDVAFTFEYIRDAPSDVNWWSIMQDLTSATAVGNTVTCVFSVLYSFALDNLGEIYILPEHIWSTGTGALDTRWNDHTDVEAHVGSGPFMYVARVPDEYTELDRFADWWGTDNPNVGQLPNIEKVRIDVVLGQDARILAMRSGAADTERYEVFGAYVNEILTAPELQLVTGVASQWDYVWGFNLTVAGLDDVDVRTAMSLAIDRAELINIGRLGFGTATTSAIPDVFYPGLAHADGVFPENVTLANEILDAAGYVDNDADGVRNFPGAPGTPELEFDILTLSWDDISVSTGTGIKLQMQDIGIKINNMVTDDGPMYDAIYTGEYEMYTMAHGYTPIPDFVWWRCHSDNIYEWGDNVFHLDNATVDTIMDDYVASTPATLAANARLAQLAVLQNLPYVPLYLSDDTHALRAEWVNWTAPAGGPFTAYNPRAMVFMYDDTFGETTPPPTGGTDFVLILGIGAGALLVGIVVTYFIVRKK